MGATKSSLAGQMPVAMPTSDGKKYESEGERKRRGREAEKQ